MRAGNTIVVGDKSYIQSKVVMLPTEKDYQIGQFGIWINKSIKGNELVCGKKTQEPYNMECVPQHLYFLSDEEIKEGWEGWAFKKDVKGQVFKHFYTTNSWYNDAKKIIATTDESLMILTTMPEAMTAKYLPLPRPSNEFLQAYSRSNGKIKEVLVEVEREMMEAGTDYYVKYDEREEDICGTREVLKVSPDNTITIKPFKESWNRQEVISLLKKYEKENSVVVSMKLGSKLDLTGWIAENL